MKSRYDRDQYPEDQAHIYGSKTNNFRNIRKSQPQFNRRSASPALRPTENLQIRKNRALEYGRRANAMNTTVGSFYRTGLYDDPADNKHPSQFRSKLPTRSNYNSIGAPAWNNADVRYQPRYTQSARKVPTGGARITSNAQSLAKPGPRNDILKQRRFKERYDQRRNLDDEPILEGSRVGEIPRRSRVRAPGQPRRSLSMKEAVQAGELTLHDDEAKVDQHPTALVRREAVVPLQSRRSRSRGGQVRTSQLSRGPEFAPVMKTYEPNPAQDVNNFQNFFAKERRDRMVHEYPVIGNGRYEADYSRYGRERRMDDLYRNIENDRDTNFCGSGDQACVLI